MAYIEKEIGSSPVVEVDLGAPDAEMDQGSLDVTQIAGAEETRIVSVREAGMDVPILVIGTPDRIVEIEVVGDRFVIGRAPDCDAVLSDQLVSRHHAIIERRSNGWHLVDQRSGNGTFLDNERIREARLSHGSVIRMGDTRIVFDMAGEYRTLAGSGQDRASWFPAPAGNQREDAKTAGSDRQKLMLAGVLVLAILIFTLGILVMSGKPGAPKYTAPAASFAKILPDDEELRRHRELAAMEAASQRALAEARTNLKAEDFEAALAALDRVPAESTQAERARDLEKEIRERIRYHRLDQLCTDLGEDECDLARMLADELLLDRPGPEEDARLERLAKAFIKSERAPEDKMAEAEEDEDEYEDDEELYDESEEMNDEPEEMDDESSQPSEDQFADEPETLLEEDSLEAYRNGHLTVALDKAKASGVEAEGVAVLSRFRMLLDRCENLFQTAERIEPVEDCMFQALQLDARLGGGQGKVTENIHLGLSKLYYFRGIKDKNDNNNAAALRNLNKALRYNPSLQKAKELIREMEEGK
jgi:tetratricopeptide (TPR) repeat protein